MATCVGLARAKTEHGGLHTNIRGLHDDFLVEIPRIEHDKRRQDLLCAGDRTGSLRCASCEVLSRVRVNEQI
jgi:hypothetical protein